MSFTDDEMLTTLAAGELVGRSQTALRSAIYVGALTGGIKDRNGAWLVPRAEVLAWAARTRAAPRTSRPWERVADGLREWGPANAEELGRLLQLHPGNVRKYLRILELEGRAHRGADSQWELTRYWAAASPDRLQTA